MYLILLIRRSGIGLLILGFTLGILCSNVYNSWVSFPVFSVVFEQQPQMAAEPLNLTAIPNTNNAITHGFNDAMKFAAVVTPIALVPTPSPSPMLALNSNSTPALISNSTNNSSFSSSSVIPDKKAPLPPTNQTGTKRLLCFVMTMPSKHEKQAKHVKATWGKRCHILVFISTAFDETLPTVAMPNITEGREYLLGKIKTAFQHVYAKYLDKADFFLKADDDTYVIVENLLHLLEPYDPEKLVYLGCSFKQQGGYMSGGAGYVVSRAALKLLVEKGFPDSKICTAGNNGHEDFEIGKCFRNLNVSMGDSRDEDGRHRFLPLRVVDHVNKGHISAKKTNWVWNYLKFKGEDGPECCSKYPVSFHYMEGEQQVAIDHLLYKTRVYPNL